MAMAASGNFEFPVHADVDVLYSALATSARAVSTPEIKLQANPVRVRPQRFGTERAFSIQLASEARQEEIGKLVIQDLDKANNWVLILVPENLTGGADPSRLDVEGVQFWRVFRAFWNRLHQLGIISLSEPGNLTSQLPEHQWLRFREWKSSRG